MKSLTEEEESKNLGGQWGTAKSKKASLDMQFFFYSIILHKGLQKLAQCCCQCSWQPKQELVVKI